ncbi:DUF4262 domain-containing protein [Ideonella sp. DXS29W]|uniref:DUF4262 domain-containing protein n=1 Tax=Ideonella lacteola TaxID=2984193 RepID=A0ABU9BYE6_9BURK
MSTLAERRAANDKRVADDIREYGCHVISVFDPEEKQPAFSYSVGIQEMTGAPEAIVIGVQPSLGHFMVNEYNRQVRAGTKFERGVLYSGFLAGFSIYIEPVKPSRLHDYALGCDRYYKGKPFSTVQLIYPTTTGVWPWQAGASQWFKSNQVMLGRQRPNRP